MPRHIPEHNQVSLDEPLLIKILDDFSERLYHYFRATVCLVVHGGAVMVLHPSLRCRQNTRDVDYIHRSFESEWKKRGVHDAGDRLNRCIADTAAQFGLGLDWMNAHADVALPMAYDKHARLYDPIYAEAMQPNNIALNTIYSKRGLKLVGVSWSWAVALKLVRYRKEDPDDIAAILKLGTQLKGLQWTRTIMEGWLLGSCSPMGYANYGQEQIELTRQKMRDAVKRAQSLAWPAHSASTYSLASQSTAAVERPPTAPSELSSGHPTLRHRAKSFSQQRLSAPAVMTSSSMPLIAMPRPSMHAQPQMLVPHHTGSSTRTHATPVSMTHIPVVSMFPGGRLPPGFVPYAVMPSPPGHQHPPHYPISYRIRT